MATIFDRITAFNKNRLPGMVKLKYKAMAVNAFTFYRGSCHLFYEDLAAAKALQSSPLAWICGDLHLENFGSFRGNNNLEYFDMNDFDEGALAPAAWDIVRMATSIFVAFKSLDLDDTQALRTAKMYLDSYSDTLKKGKAISIDPRTADGIVQTFLTTVEKRKQKDMLKKRTKLKGGKLVFLVDNERYFELDPSQKKELIRFMKERIKDVHYGPGNYKVEDCVFRVAGTGSIGVKRYLFLLKGRDTKTKYLLLDMKQALPSSVQPYLKTQQPQWASDAERTIAIQKRMQYVSPALLSPVVFKDEPYVVKQMQPTEDKIDFGLIKKRPADVDKVINDMAVLTASAQLRSSGREGSSIADEFIAFGQTNQWDAAVLKYAQQYAVKVKNDYKEFMDAYKKGLY